MKGEMGTFRLPQKYVLIILGKVFPINKKAKSKPGLTLETIIPQYETKGSLSELRWDKVVGNERHFSSIQLHAVSRL
jgi:hypothetical protein